MAKKEKQEQTFESRFKRLEEILHKLENETDETSLEKVLEYYSEGLTLLKDCRAKLNEAELKIEKINLNGGAN